MLQKNSIEVAIFMNVDNLLHKCFYFR